VVDVRDDRDVADVFAERHLSRVPAYGSGRQVAFVIAPE
jgi:hypothetical protein